MAIKPSILQSWGPGGWQFYQPQTDWHAPGPLENTFQQQVDNIVKMRQANPRFKLPTDPAVVAADLEAYTIARWEKMYSRRGMAKFLANPPEEVKKKGSNTTHNSKHSLRGVAAAAGIDTRALEDWLGAGGTPVPQELANARAAVCVPCRANQGGWTRTLTVPAARAVRAYLEHKNRMKLATPHDPQLQSCKACTCVLTLKVFQPIQHIKDNTSPETFEKHREYNPDCWVLREL